MRRVHQVVVDRDDTPRWRARRAALHKRGAADGFYSADSRIDDLMDARILHVGGVGLMNRMDSGRSKEIMAGAKRREVIATLGVFVSTSDDLPKVARLLPCTNCFLPSQEEAQALSGLTDNRDLA